MDGWIWCLGKPLKIPLINALSQKMTGPGLSSELDLWMGLVWDYVSVNVMAFS